MCYCKADKVSFIVRGYNIGYLGANHRVIEWLGLEGISSHSNALLWAGVNLKEKKKEERKGRGLGLGLQKYPFYSIQRQMHKYLLLILVTGEAALVAVT